MTAEPAKPSGKDETVEDGPAKKTAAAAKPSGSGEPKAGSAASPAAPTPEKGTTGAAGKTQPAATAQGFGRSASTTPKAGTVADTAKTAATSKPAPVSETARKTPSAGATTGQTTTGKAAAGQTPTGKAAAGKPETTPAGDVTKTGKPAGDPKDRPESPIETPTAPAGPKISDARPSRHTSFAALTFAALLGGALALVGYVLITDSDRLFGGAETGDEQAAAIAEAEAQIADLQQRIESLAAADDSGTGAAIPPLIDRLDQLEVSLGEIRDTAPAAGGDIDAATLAALQETAEAARADAEEALRRVESMSGETGTDETAGALDEQLTALERQIEELRSGSAESGDRLAALGDRIDQLATTVEQRIVPAMAEIEEAASAARESQKVARSVSARALNTVLEQGGRFAGEAAAAAALIGDSKTARDLRAVAETEVKSEAALNAEFDRLADEMIRSGGTSKTEESGVIARLVGSAKSLVKVRPAGPQPGNSVPAIVSRIEAALEEGALQRAYSEWQRLPPPAKTISEEFAADLNNRIEAEQRIEAAIDALNEADGSAGSRNGGANDSGNATDGESGQAGEG